MKRKLLCLLLSAVFVFSGIVMSACSTTAGTDTTGGEDGGKKKNDSTLVRSPMTLTLWVPTDENTTAESISQVEAALNKITQAKYSTAIELHAVAYDKYEDQLNARMKSIKEILDQTEAEKKARKEAERAARKRGETLAPETTAETEDPNASSGATVNEYGMTFPSVTSTQLDIFLIKGYDNFKKYSEDLLLSSITDELNGNSKLIKSYVYPTFLDMAQTFNSNYAVPNNHPLGEYTYLLVNKELCDSYYYDIDSMDTLLNCKDFILDVAKNANITPLLTTTDIPGLHYWSEDGSFSFLASMISDDQDPTSKLNIRNVFGLKPFVNTTLMLKELQEAGAIGTNPDEKNFGVGVIKGDAKAVKEYKDKYYIKVLEKPRATTDDVFESMFAVSTYTKDVSRSMEILKLLNTDTEFRTILQYGVKGVNWTEETDPETKETVLKVLNNDYIMNIVDTGNVFITYPGDGLPMSYWDDYRQQNLDSLLYPLIKFQDYIDDDNKEYFDEMKSYSAEIYSRISKMSAKEFEEAAASIKEEIADSVIYNIMVDDKSTEAGYDSLIVKYTSFYNENFKNK